MQLNQNILDVVEYLQQLVPSNQPNLDVYHFETSNPASYPYLTVVPDTSTVDYKLGNKTNCSAVYTHNIQVRAYDDRNNWQNSPEATEERMRILFDDIINYLQTPNIPSTICDFRINSVVWNYEETASDTVRTFVLQCSFSHYQPIV